LPVIPSSRVSVRDLGDDPYSGIVCYPRGNSASEPRIRELECLGVSEVHFEGTSQIGRLHILGKGCVSVVVKVLTPRGVEALKIRRIDADRPSMRREAELLVLANSVGVGPRLSAQSDNFLLMELVVGQPFPRWVRSLPGKGRTERLRRVVSSLLDQCSKLDRIGLDHGELSNLSKHVLVNGRPTVIDFESGSTVRRPANVTAATQYLFIGGPLTKRIRRTLRSPPAQELIPLLRAYKRSYAKDDFLRLLRELKLITSIEPATKG